MKLYYKELAKTDWKFHTVLGEFGPVWQCSILIILCMSLELLLIGIRWHNCWIKIVEKKHTTLFDFAYDLRPDTSRITRRPFKVHKNSNMEINMDKNRFVVVSSDIYILGLWMQFFIWNEGRPAQVPQGLPQHKIKTKQYGSNKNNGLAPRTINHPRLAHITSGHGHNTPEECVLLEAKFTLVKITSAYGGRQPLRPSSIDSLIKTKTSRRRHTRPCPAMIQINPPTNRH